MSNSSPAVISPYVKSELLFFASVFSSLITVDWGAGLNLVSVLSLYHNT